MLSNYGVFAEGFDAPAVRAVYVARPTYSPTRYQQMIGRGLRGPLNGGKEVCLIANVADNVRQFGEDFAFTQFEYLWSGQSAGTACPWALRSRLLGRLLKAMAKAGEALSAVELSRPRETRVFRRRSRGHRYAPWVALEYVLCDVQRLLDAEGRCGRGHRQT